MNFPNRGVTWLASLSLCVLGHSSLVPAAAQCSSVAAPPAFPISKAKLTGWFRSTARVMRDEAQLIHDWQGRYFSLGGQSGGWFQTEEPDGLHKPVFRCYDLGQRPGVEFDGNDRLTTSSSTLPAFSGDYTASLVIRADLSSLTLGARAYLYSRAKSPGLLSSTLYIDDQGRLVAEHEGSPLVVSSSSLADATTHVVSVSYDQALGRLRLFVDGSEVANASGIGSHNDASLTLGAYFDGSSYSDYFRGSLGEIVIFNRELDDTAEREPLEDYLTSKYTDLPTAELDFTRIPADFAIVARESLTAATTPLTVTGTIESAGVTGLRLELQPSGVIDENLSPPPVGVPFTLEVDLPVDSPAPPVERDIEVSARIGGVWIPVAHRQKIVAGDVFLISGQSQAVAADYHDEDPITLVQNPQWIRSFGHSWWQESTTAPSVFLENDLHWGRGVVPDYSPFDAFSQFAHAGVGTLGLAIADEIFGQTKVPVAVLQQGWGGTLIEVHVPGSSLATRPYEALEYRTEQAHLKELVRGYIWIQGYQDAAGIPFLMIPPTPPAQYRALFQTLFDAWRDGVSGFGNGHADPLRVYTIQSFPWACCFDSTVIQEEQRRIANDGVNFPDLRISSGAPFEGWVVSVDDCHPSSVHDGTNQPIGYFTIGERVAQQILEDLYLVTPSSDIDPPDIETITKADQGGGIYHVTFDFDRDVLCEPGAECGFYFDGDPALRGTFVAASDDELTLSVTFEPTTATYRGHDGDDDCSETDGPAGCPDDSRPWVTNADGLAALLFRDVLVE